MENCKITINLQEFQSANVSHDVRRSINWVKRLVSNGTYERYLYNKRFVEVFVDDMKDVKNGVTLKPFKAFYIVNDNATATIYVSSVSTEAFYNLLLFYWRRRDKRVELSYKPIFIEPDSNGYHCIELKGIESDETAVNVDD